MLSMEETTTLAPLVFKGLDHVGTHKQARKGHKNLPTELISRKIDCIVPINCILPQASTLRDTNLTEEVQNGLQEFGGLS